MAVRVRSGTAGLPVRDQGRFMAPNQPFGRALSRTEAIMNRHARNARRLALAGTFAFATVLMIPAVPAQARLNDPGTGGAVSGGFFHGLPVRAQARTVRPSDPELTGVAGDNCYTLRQTVQDRLGGTLLRTVRVCE
jgi:hypothetical protein